MNEYGQFNPEILFQTRVMGFREEINQILMDVNTDVTVYQDQGTSNIICQRRLCLPLNDVENIVLSSKEDIETGSTAYTVCTPGRVGPIVMENQDEFYITCGAKSLTVSGRSSSQGRLSFVTEPDSIVEAFDCVLDAIDHANEEYIKSPPSVRRKNWLRRITKAK